MSWRFRALHSASGSRAFASSEHCSHSIVLSPSHSRTPLSAIVSETVDQGSATTASVAKVQIARSQDGSTRCAVPQYGRPPNQFQLVDIEHGRQIFYGCAQVVNDSKRRLVYACQGQSVTVRPFSARVQHLTDADVELRLQQLAAAPPSTRAEGTLMVERHVMGQRLIHDVLCVGFQDTRQGTEPGMGKGRQAQQVNRTQEEWISPVYGVMETSSADRLRGTHTHSSFEQFQAGEPASELLAVPPAYQETLIKAVAASPQTVSIAEPIR